MRSLRGRRQGAFHFRRPGIQQIMGLQRDRLAGRDARRTRCTGRFVRGAGQQRVRTGRVAHAGGLHSVQTGCVPIRAVEALDRGACRLGGLCFARPEQRQRTQHDELVLDGGDVARLVRGRDLQRLLRGPQRRAVGHEHRHRPCHVIARSVGCRAGVRDLAAVAARVDHIDLRTRLGLARYREGKPLAYAVVATCMYIRDGRRLGIDHHGRYPGTGHGCVARCVGGRGRHHIRTVGCRQLGARKGHTPLAVGPCLGLVADLAHRDLHGAVGLGRAGDGGAGRLFRGIHIVVRAARVLHDGGDRRRLVHCHGLGGGRGNIAGQIAGRNRHGGLARGGNGRRRHIDQPGPVGAHGGFVGLAAKGHLDQAVRITRASDGQRLGCLGSADQVVGRHRRDRGGLGGGIVGRQVEGR